jgi:thioredoxin 1
MASKNVLTITDDNFEAEVLQSPIPVMVYFYAQWASPCKQMSPIVGKFADEYVGKIKVGGLDIDGNREMPKNYSVRDVPAVIVFKEGQKVGQKVGLTTHTNLVSLLEL